jgi:ribonuclease-3 family protein
MLALRERSIRTLAWLGDAEFEREVRLRVAARGDWPTDRLDRIRAQIVSAEGQTRLLQVIESALDSEESAVLRRARNLKVRPGSRTRDVRTARSATGLEALIAFWCLGGELGRARWYDLLSASIEAAIDSSLAASQKPRRG